MKQMNMKRTTLLLAATACLLLTNVLPASARPVRIWHPDELWENADLVVVATAETTRDEHKVENAKADTWVSVLTKFDVQAVLKGRLATNWVSKKVSVTVRHDRYYDRTAEDTVVDGPAFVEFDPNASNRYLIFLAGKPGEIYEPLTGQYDPWQSFLLLEQFRLNREREEVVQISDAQLAEIRLAVATNDAAISASNAVRTTVKSDDSGTYVVGVRPRKHLTVHDRDGKLLFDGPIESSEEQAAVPKEIWEKVEPMLEKRGRPSPGRFRE